MADFKRLSHRSHTGAPVDLGRLFVSTGEVLKILFANRVIVSSQSCGSASSVCAAESLLASELSQPWSAGWRPHRIWLPVGSSRQRHCCRNGRPSVERQSPPARRRVTARTLFVGYSLTDDTFHKVMHEVRKARGPLTGPVGTAVVLFDDPLLEELWGDTLEIVPLAPRPRGLPAPSDVAAAASGLDRLLDRIGLLAADVSSFLLDTTYKSMLDDEERAIAGVLADAAALIDRGTGPVAEFLQRQFRSLGTESP